MKTLKRIFSSSTTTLRQLHPAHCRHCQKKFSPKDALDEFCSSRCLKNYNSRPAQSQRKSPTLAGQPNFNYYQAALVTPPGNAHGSSRRYRSHTTSRHAPHAIPSQPPTPAYSLGSGRQGAQYPYPPSYSPGTLPSYSGWPSPNPQYSAKHMVVATPPSAIPPHLQMARSSSSPVKSRSTQRPRRLDISKRPSSAGHTPGVALRPLPAVGPPTATFSTTQSTALPRRGHNHIYRPIDRPVPTQVKIAAPSPIHPHPPGDIIASLEERIERPVPPPTEWHFAAPPTPSISSTSSGDDREVHGGFYDVNGNHVDVQFGGDLSWRVADTNATWKTASSATLVPIPPRARELDGTQTPIYPTGGYVPRLSARTAATSSRALRPRSNSFGGY
ncbi:hypothetical protein BC628DRAFT_220511 [Trametes gibbosa]|nr:hypothetical protein BC628DRAFT_220511 [Trametes gibbosa]